MKTKKQKVEARFQILKDGWIKDNQTGLEWGPSSKESLNFKDAEKYCKENGGRLPTRVELESIQDLTKYNPCIDKDIFKDTFSSWYWSSTKCAWNSSVSWCVSFYDGLVIYYLESYDDYVRPCRAGQ